MLQGGALDPAEDFRLKQKGEKIQMVYFLCLLWLSKLDYISTHNFGPLGVQIMIKNGLLFFLVLFLFLFLLLFSFN